jgi:acyl carrier protein
LKVVVFIEEEFNFRLVAEDVNLGRFDSLDSVASLIKIYLIEGVNR